MYMCTCIYIEDYEMLSRLDEKKKDEETVVQNLQRISNLPESSLTAEQVLTGNVVLLTSCATAPPHISRCFFRNAGPPHLLLFFQPAITTLIF
jgi:hypothetical protein